MKKTVNTLRILFVLLFVSTTYSVSAQDGPPPPPGGSNNTGTNKLNGGGAPIGGGLFILLGLGAAYGARKIYQLRTENIEE